jgi:hypothetical protein
VLADESQCLEANFFEGNGVQDQVIGGRHHEQGLRVLLFQLVGNVGYAGRCILTGGFAEDILQGQCRELHLHDVHIFIGRDDIDVLRRNERGEPFIG